MSTELGKPKDALALYDEVLKSDTGASEKHKLVCGKVDIFFEMGTTDPNNYQRAIEIYDQLASDKDEPVALARSGALFGGAVFGEKKRARQCALERFLQNFGGRRTSKIGGANSYHITRRGLTPRACWRKIGTWESAAAIYEKLAAGKSI